MRKIFYEDLLLFMADNNKIEFIKMTVCQMVVRIRVTICDK